MTEFERLSSTPPPVSTFWGVFSADGQQLRLYRTEKAAKQQLKRFPVGSTVRQA
jgi:hypothetical protein